MSSYMMWWVCGALDGAYGCVGIWDLLGSEGECSEVMIASMVRFGRFGGCGDVVLVMC